MVQVVKPSAELEWITPDAELAIERATRKCYQSTHAIDCDNDACWNGPRLRSYPAPDHCHTPGGCMNCRERAGKFIRMLLKRGHEAPLGHAVASFTFVTDRGITHELVRHRLADYCQESTRYCNYGKGRFGKEIKVIEPPGLDDTEKFEPDGQPILSERDLWLYACGEAEGYYMALTDAGVKAEIARSVLPTCLKTEITMTCNLREWRHVIALRSELNKAAHPQIREIIEMTRTVLKGHCPNVFHDR